MKTLYPHFKSHEFQLITLRYKSLSDFSKCFPILSYSKPLKFRSARYNYFLNQFLKINIYVMLTRSGKSVKKDSHSIIVLHNIIISLTLNY